MEKENHSKLKSIVLKRAVVTGLVGGLGLSVMFLVMHYFNFIEINPMYIFKVLLGDGVWETAWYAKVIFILIMCILSILVAMIYFFTLKSIESWLAGGLYGISIWSLLFILLPLIVEKFHDVTERTNHTNVSLFTVFLLYGLFIGYSISFDYKCVKINAGK